MLPQRGELLYLINVQRMNTRDVRFQFQASSLLKIQPRSEIIDAVPQTPDMPQSQCRSMKAEPDAFKLVCLDYSMKGVAVLGVVMQLSQPQRISENEIMRRIEIEVFTHACLLTRAG